MLDRVSGGGLLRTRDFRTVRYQAAFIVLGWVGVLLELKWVVALSGAYLGVTSVALLLIAVLARRHESEQDTVSLALTALGLGGLASLAAWSLDALYYQLSVAGIGILLIIAAVRIFDSSDSTPRTRDGGGDGTSRQMAPDSSSRL
jgi:hypothetical protein